jgi:hypothetical protein
MPIIAILEWPAAEGLDLQAEYRHVADELNEGRPFSRVEDWGGGMIAHAVAATGGGGGLVVDVWEDQAHMDAWMQKVMPLIPDTPQPDVRILETINVVTAAQPAHV